MTLHEMDDMDAIDDGAAANGKLVVVIDDNADAADGTVLVLTLFGHRVHAAYDGRSGLALARSLEPDAVLCDISLPDIDGCDVARAIRSDAALASTRLVALTGFADEEGIRRTRDAGFDAHLVKPAQVHEVLHALNCGEGADQSDAALNVSQLSSRPDS